MESISYKHPDDNHGGNHKGALAQDLFAYILRDRQKRFGNSWEKTSRDWDIKGVDFIIKECGINGKRLEHPKESRIGVTGYWVSDFPEHLRLRVGASDDCIPHIYNSLATHWAIFSSCKNIFYIYETSDIREFLKKSEILKLPICRCRVAEAIQRNVIQSRFRPSSGMSDWYYFPKIIDLNQIRHDEIPVKNTGVVYE
jgi:hypothetical protein